MFNSVATALCANTHVMTVILMCGMGIFANSDGDVTAASARCTARQEGKMAVAAEKYQIEILLGQNLASCILCLSKPARVRPSADSWDR